MQMLGLRTLQNQTLHVTTPFINVPQTSENKFIYLCSMNSYKCFTLTYVYYLDAQAHNAFSFQSGFQMILSRPIQYKMAAFKSHYKIIL